MIRKSVTDAPITESEIDFVILQLRKREFLKKISLAILLMALCAIVLMHLLGIIGMIFCAISFAALSGLAYFIVRHPPLKFFQYGINFNGCNYGIRNIHLISTKARNADVVALLKGSEADEYVREYIRLVMRQKRPLREFEVRQLNVIMRVDAPL